MNIYYYFGNKIREPCQNRIINALKRLEFDIKQSIKTEKDIITSIYALESNGTPICRGVLDTEHFVIQYLKKNITFYIENNGIITGLIIFYLHNDGSLVIDMLCTPLLPISKGIARTLLEMVLNLSKKLHISKVVLTSTKNAIEFYYKNGFKKDPNNIENPLFMDMAYTNRKIT